VIAWVETPDYTYFPLLISPSPRQGGGREYTHTQKRGEIKVSKYI
jgi:hypothetical protein